MNLSDLAKAMHSQEPESQDKARKMIGDWENIVCLYTPSGLMIFESESEVNKFMKDNPNFFPADIQWLPMKKGRVCYNDGKPYADFGDFQLEF